MLWEQTPEKASVCGAGEPGQLGQGVLWKKLITIISVGVNGVEKQLISTRVGGDRRTHDTLAAFYQPDFIYQQMGDQLRCRVQTFRFHRGLLWQRHFLQKTNKWENPIKSTSSSGSLWPRAWGRVSFQPSPYGCSVNTQPSSHAVAGLQAAADRVEPVY